jgi:hypothetical protein
MEDDFRLFQLCRKRRNVFMDFQDVPKRKKNTRRVIMGTILALSLSTPAQNDDYYGLPTAEPESVGISTEKLEAIKANLQPLIDEHKVPGFVTVVARKGKVVATLGGRTST